MSEAVTAQRMKYLDRLAINRYGIPSLLLMERAGKGLAEEVIKRAAIIRGAIKPRRPRVWVLCGKGNNGGDGVVCARYLISNGIDTRLFIIGKTGSITGDPAVQLEILETMGAKIFTIKNRAGLKRLSRLAKADIVVDAIFGIGFKGKARGIYKEVIEFINRLGAYTFSADLPSGLNATTGEVRGVCVRADETITMGLAKTGFYRKEGPDYAGKVKVVDIGLPEGEP